MKKPVRAVLIALAAVVVAIAVFSFAAPATAHQTCMKVTHNQGLCNAYVPLDRLG